MAMDRKEEKNARASGRKRPEAFDAACGILSVKEYTCSEMRSKLRAKGYGEAETEDAISRLCESRLLDDRHYAELYIEYAVSKGHGLRRIKNDLRRKGIAEFDIEDVFYEADQDRVGPDAMREMALAQAAAVIASGRSPGEDGRPDDRLIAKAGRKLKTLGYENDEIYYAIGKLMKMRDNDYE